MTHQKLPIDWPLLERAFADCSGTTYLLDTQMGRLISTSPNADAAEREAMDRKRCHPHGRFVEIEPITEYEEAEDLFDFLEQGVAVEILPLLSRLAWEGPGLWKRFDRLLRPFPTERERWESFRTGRLRWRIRQFLEEAGIVLD